MRRKYMVPQEMNMSTYSVQQLVDSMLEAGYMVPGWMLPESDEYDATRCEEYSADPYRNCWTGE